MDARLLALFIALADIDRRAGATTALARLLEVDGALLFVRDPELGKLLPAPGCPQTLTGGPSWRAFLGSCAQPGVHAADVDFPRGNLTRAVSHTSSDGVALILFGPPANEQILAGALGLLPLVGATLRAEHALTLARGEMEVAQATGRRANDLAVALDASRGELELALSEAARLNDELKRIDRKKDDFLAMLGHELRNPMAAIAGALEVMRARPDDPSQFARARRIIERQAAQLARLVDDLLDVARITRDKISLRLEHVDVEEIVRRAVDAIEPIVSTRGHAVEVEIRDRPRVDADCARLEQMVTNLLANAAKYTNPGGKIRVVVAVEQTHAVVEVEDDGIGISPEMLPKIFDAFHQVDDSIERTGGGLGVGLTVVSRLAALHHGRVEVRSVLGEGSVFTLRLPLAKSAPPEVAVKEPERATAKRRVLVVDDNADSVEMITTLIETWGHETSSAADGPSAVERALEWRPDVVLLDIGLPGMDGYEVAAKLRRAPTTCDARIIAVSGYGLESDRKKSHAAGCDHHLVKPVDLKALARAIDG